MVLSNKPAAWKLALWARDSIEPAMLRVPIVIIIFLVLWAMNLWILDKLRIPYHFVLSIKSANLTGVLSIAVFFLVTYGIIITMFSNALGWTIELGMMLFYIFVVIAQFLPLVPGPDNRTAFFRLSKLVFLPGGSISFPEVLLADALTSLSKVFKDFGTTAVAIYVHTSGKDILDYHDSSMILVAILASLPFAIRVRQCAIQLDSCPDTCAKIPVSLNILKYLSAFPAIWLTAAASLGYAHPKLPEYITIAATVNSLYSFAWDIVMDWGLISITRDRRIYRRQRALLPWYVYILAMVVNFVLRFSWTVNRIPGMNHIHSSVIVLAIEIGEVFRRAMWNIFRIEWEIIVQQDKANEKDPDSSIDKSFAKSRNQSGNNLLG